MFISTLTPGAPLSVFKIAIVEITSTRVAVNPPCSVPPRLVCSSSTRISHTTLPGAEDNTSTWGKHTVQLVKQVHAQRAHDRAKFVLLLNKFYRYSFQNITFCRTLSKPGFSTIALIICFSEFKGRETILYPMSNFCLLHTGNAGVW